MKLHLVLISLFALTLAAIIGATALKRHQQTAAPAASQNQVFEVKGLVKSRETDGVTVHIAHEEIPGFMPAMIMPFTVKDAGLLRGISPGDRVAFELVVSKDDSWISRIEKIGEATPAEQAQAATSAPADALRVEVGQTVPDFSFVDDHGKARRLSEFRGQALVLTFVYTRCPLPNFCPLMSKNFADLQQCFQKEFPGKAHLLSVSFDPQFDTPEVLQRYGALYEQDPNLWTFATGTPEQVDRITGIFGLIREPSNGFINHDLRTALISPEGRLVHVWRSNVWTPYEVQRMVRESLNTAFAASR